ENGEDRRAGDLTTEAGRHVLDARRDRLHLRRQVIGQLVLLGLCQLLHADLEALVLVAARGLAAPLDDGVAAADRGRLVAYLGERRRRLRLERDLDAAPEVDAEVQAARRQ